MSDFQQPGMIEGSKFLELREANIARNQNFLRSLGVLSEDPQPIIKRKRSENAIDTHGSNLQRSQSLDYRPLFDAYPHRRDEIGAIVDYLQQTECPVPALLLSGAAGTGKFSIANSALKLQSLVSPSLTFICSGFSDRRSFIAALWAAASESLYAFTFRGLHSEHSNKIKKFNRSTSNLPTTFGMFVTYLHALIVELSSKNIEFKTSSFMILFRRISKADELESALASRLLSLSKLCHSQIKIVATTNRCMRTYIDASIHLSFKSYTESQLQQVVLAEAKRTFLIPSDCNKNSTCDSSTSVSFVRTKAAHEQQKLRALERAAQEKSELDKFILLLDHVLPRLYLVTRDVASLSRLACSVWKIVSIRDRERESAIAAGTTAVSFLSIVTSAATIILSRPAAGIFVDDRHQARVPDAISSVGIPGESVVDTHLRGRDWTFYLPLSHKYLILAAYIASRNPKELDATAFGMVNSGKRKKARKVRKGGNVRNNKDDGDEMLLEDFAEIPSPENGVSVHGGTKGGAAVASAHSSSSSVQACLSRAQLRPFSLERLLGIFGQIYCMGGVEKLGSGLRAAAVLRRTEQRHNIAQEISSGYGDAHLFATVNNLVNQGLLIRLNSFSVAPAYQSTTTPEMALAIAQSIGFPLQDLILNKG